MKMKTYNKLVRDRIPEIMRGLGKGFTTRTLDDDSEFALGLSRKLLEEAEEFAASGDLSELADLLEVVHGIIDHRGVAFDEIEALRIAKREKRGGFTKRVMLVEGEV